MAKFDLVVVVVCYNMQREIRRTLLSLSPEYQNVSAEHYKVVLIDNGSSKEVDFIDEFDHFVDYRYVRDAEVSPVSIINKIISGISAKYVAVMIDGARILSPGIIQKFMVLASAYPNIFVNVPSYHLGSMEQSVSTSLGYTKKREDNLIRSSGWPVNKHGLFSISCFAGSYRRGVLRGYSESNLFMMKTTDYLALGGYDQAFTSPGGGAANLYFFSRVCDLFQGKKITLACEGTFHQFHGGVSTSKSKIKRKDIWSAIESEYKAISGRSVSVPNIDNFELFLMGYEEHVQLVLRKSRYLETALRILFVKILHRLL